jgi:hypothetical protein
MAEKVIHEVRFIETDDGFRIEVKGDKERMKEMGFGPGMGFWPGMGFGPRMHFWRAGRKHRHGPGFRPPWMWGWWGEEPEGEEGEEESGKEA